MIVFVGAKVDGRGDGQPAVVASVGSPVTFLTALPGTPANGDVIYASQIAYHDESVAHTLTTRRVLVGYSSSPTAGQQYHLMGGQLAGVSINLPIGQNAIPTITLTYRFAYWDRSAVTIPDTALSLVPHFGGPIVGERTFFQSVATATAATVRPAEMEIALDLGLAPIPGGATGRYAQIGGWARTAARPTCSMRVPWADTYETLFDAANESYLNSHLLWNSNTLDGRRVGFYLPSAFLVGQRPSPPTMVNDQTYVALTWAGTEGPTTTTELTRSAIRLVSA
jgi:hypothetical protein